MDAKKAATQATTVGPVAVTAKPNKVGSAVATKTTQIIKTTKAVMPLLPRQQPNSAHQQHRHLRHAQQHLRKLARALTIWTTTFRSKNEKNRFGTCDRCLQAAC